MTTVTDNLRGAGLMALAMTAFTVNDVFIKLLAGILPLSQVIVLRSILVVVAFGAWAAWRRQLWLTLQGRDGFWLTLRCGAEAGAAFFFLTALFNMDISALSAILQALPLTVTLGAALFFGEAVGWRRLLAIGVGFVGVMMIVRPGTEDFTIYAVFGVATVLCATVRDLATRQLSPDMPSTTVALVTAAVVAVMGGVMTLTDDPWAPVSASSALVLMGATAMICLAYLTIVMTMRVGDVGFVAPFRYSSLVAATIAGVTVFGERPDGWTIAGSLIVVGSGLYMLWREQRIAQEPVTQG